MTLKKPDGRTRVRRQPERGAYDRETIYAILDEAFVCHVGFVFHGSPVVIPMAYARDGERLLIHGSTASRTMRALAEGAEACIAVTLFDAFVLARSAFHHSMNYRSVVLFARGNALEPDADKVHAMHRFFDHVLPGRWDDCRPPNEKEIRATTMMAFPLEEASAKTRTGPVLDDAGDYALPHWAGLLPWQSRALAPVADERLPGDIDVPDYLEDHRRER